MVFFLIFAVYMTLRTNFIVSDFWRWLVVRMWVEVAFEIFTTVIVAYLYREMGIVSKAKAERASYTAWLFYGCSAMVFFLFFTINMTPKTNFIVSDLGQCPEVHVWEVVMFEIFTVVIVSYRYREMGIVSAARLHLARPLARRFGFWVRILFEGVQNFLFLWLLGDRLLPLPQF